MKILFLSLFFVIQSFFISQNRIVLAIDQQDTPATEVIGQPDLYTNLNLILGLHYPRSVIGVNNKIYVSDWGCARIAVYDPITQNHQAKIATLGQPSTSDCTNNNGGVSNHSLYETRGISTDGVHFFVADTSNNRVLIWNSIPTTNAAPADVVVGQPDMSSNTANNGGITAHSLNAPRWVYSDGVRFYISDTANNRVLIWNSIPTTNGKDADIVLGQPDMTHNTANNGGITAHSLNGPNGINKINNKLYIADTTNNRILIFNTEPSTQADANIVLGQPNMTQNTINNGGVSAHSLYYPYNISSNNSNLIITDGFNHRVLIYSTIPSVNQADANIVLGQPDMTTNTENNGGTSAHSLDYPKDANIINNQLYVADDANHRVLIWNTVPSSNQADADLVIGQPNLVGGIYRNGSSNIFNGAEASIYDGKMLVADMGNHRVLIWNTVPTTNLPITPDVILGQPDMNHNNINNGGLSAHSLSWPQKAILCNNKLVVTDYSNQRVLIWNTFPTSNQTDADVVLGQPDMTQNSENNGGISAHSLDWPLDIACSSDNKLAVADYGNSRVLIYNSVPTTNNKDADVVIGQPNMTSRTRNNGGISSHSLDRPQGVALDSTHLFVSDTYNNRILIFNSIPIINNPDANLVLGQPDMTHNTINNGGLNSQGLNYPRFIYSDNYHVFTSDSNNSRVLGWSTFPTQNFQAADVVLGQPNFTTFTSTIGPGRLVFPGSIFFYNNNIYISDAGNSRILIFPSGPQSPSVSVPALVNTDNIDIGLSAVGAKSVKISEDPTLAGASWEPYSTGTTATLSDSEGPKQIYVQYQDYANYVGDTLSATTVLDKSPPVKDDFKINNGAAYAFNRLIHIFINAVDTYSSVSEMMISESPTFVGASWEPYTVTKDYTLSSSTGGEKYLYIKFKDAAGNISDTFSDPIILDTVTSSHTISNPNPGVIGQDLVTGYITAGSTNPTTTENFTFNVDYTINAGNASAKFPAGTVVTKTDGGTFDLTSFTTYDNTSEIIGDVTDSLGAVKIGVPDSNLSFSQPATVTIPVNSNYNGQTLKVYYRLEGSTQWVNQTTCVVANGNCSFQTTHATSFTVTQPSSANTNNSSSSGNSSSCGDAAPATAPNLFQINTNNSTAKLFFTPISNTNHYLISFSTKAIAEDYGADVYLAREGVQNFTVDQLKPNTTYYFKVRGQNGCATGNWSNTMKVTTRPRGLIKTVSFYKNTLAKAIAVINRTNSPSIPKKVPQNNTAVISQPLPTVDTPPPIINQPQTNTPTDTPLPSPPKKKCFLWWCW